MIDKVILGLPFIALLYSFTTDTDGVSTYPNDEIVKFKFLINSKTQQINFLEDEIKFKRVAEQLARKTLQRRIEDFEERVKRRSIQIFLTPSGTKRNTVKLPYIKEFNERNIPTKAKPIQMS